jgi:polyphenol oxidase
MPVPPPPALEADALAHARVAHGFFGRRGGVSTGRYDSLNGGPGSADDPEAVAENRARVAAVLGARAEALVSLHQVHGRDVIVADQPWPVTARPRADAMVTARPGLALAVLAADCAPVLFADAEAGVVGACHAGWRGALVGVAEATVSAMEHLGAKRGRIAAAIGPTIGPGSYEVGPEFPAPFLADDPEAARFFAAGRRAGRRQFDLPGYLAHRLARLGLAAVAHRAPDTCAASGEYFSYRRTTLEGGGDYGRNVSAIMLRD